MTKDEQDRRRDNPPRRSDSGPEPAGPVRVAVVDDQRIVREGLVLILGLLPDISVVWSAADGEEAARLVDDVEPDVVLMDLRMPRCDGIAATERIRSEHPGVQVIALTTFADDDLVLAALAAGARGYLTKDAGAEEIRAAIDAVTRGEARLAPFVQSKLVDALAMRNPLPPPDTVAGGAREMDLTPRELDVLRCIARGLTNGETAAQLCVGEATVKTHVNRIFAKTGVRDRAQAVIFAYEHGIVRTQ